MKDSTAIAASPDDARGRGRRSVAARLPAGRWSGFALIAGLALLWEISARYWTDSASWPPFTAVLAALVSGRGELAQVMLDSLRLMLWGFLLGSLIGVTLGLLTGLSRFLRIALTPTLEFLRPLPVPGLVPPLILLLGIDDPMKITVVAFATVFPVLINTLQGVRTVDPVLLDTARTFRHGYLKTVVSIILPASLPYILSGLRISLALALIVTIVAEMIAGSAGIGYYLLLMQYAMNPAEMYAAIIALAAAAYLLNLLIVAVETRLLRWSRLS